MIDKSRLATKCSTWNITLTPTQLDLLDKYAELLVSYNEKVNLTAITSPEGIEDRHFADSLLFAAQPEVSGRLVDVGTGARSAPRKPPTRSGVSSSTLPVPVPWRPCRC